MAVKPLKMTVPSRLDASKYVSAQGLELLSRSEFSPMVSGVNLDKNAGLESSYLCNHSQGV